MAQALRHIMRRFQDYNKDPINGFFCEPTDDPFKWKFMLLGMHDTAFEGELCNGNIIFPVTFPNDPPTFEFTSNLFHPNVYTDGKVCLSTLHAATSNNFYDQEGEKWTPVHTIQSIILSIILILQDPNNESPANLDAAKLFRENKKEFNRKMRRGLSKS